VDIIWPVVYEYETWSVAFRKENRPWVLESGELGKKFGFKRRK
jgi:hypothetical protein